MAEMQNKLEQKNKEILELKKKNEQIEELKGQYQDHYDRMRKGKNYKVKVLEVINYKRECEKL